MEHPVLYRLLLSVTALLICVSTTHLNSNDGLNESDLDQKATPQDYNGPWGAGVQCPYENPPFPDGTTVYKGSVPPAMTSDAVNYLRDPSVRMLQVSDTKTYDNLPDLSFVLRKEFHSWHYSNGQLLTGCWTGVTVYQYINQTRVSQLT